MSLFSFFESTASPRGPPAFPHSLVRTSKGMLLTDISELANPFHAALRHPCSGTAQPRNPDLTITGTRQKLRIPPMQGHQWDDSSLPALPQTGPLLVQQANLQRLYIYSNPAASGPERCVRFLSASRAEIASPK